MNRSRLQLALASVVMGMVSVSAPAQQQQQPQQQQQQQRQDAPNRAAPPPPPPRPAAPIPSDSRVPLPQDSRAPLGSTRLQGLPPASDRIRQGPVDPPHNITPRPRPGTEPQDVQGDINRARHLVDDARERYGLGGGTSGGGTGGGGSWTGRPWPHHRRYRGHYWPADRYWYNPPYVQVPYDTGVYTDPGTRREWVDDNGPADGGPPNGAGANGGADRGAGQAPPRVPDLPPDELLGDEELTPALAKALDASAEWKQATADLIRAWGAYADAVDKVLAGLQDKPEYRRARAELLRTKARLDAARAAGAAGQGRGQAGDAPPERLVAAADEALKARRAVGQLESTALSSDPDVQRAERRLDLAVDRRNQVRDQVAAKLPDADRPAPPKRPKLLEDDE